MDDSIQLLSVDQFSRFLEEGSIEDAVAYLERLRTADTVERRKKGVRRVREVARERPSEFAPVLSSLTGFLVDEHRSVRLTTVKLFVVVAEADPQAVASFVPSIADRLADEDEFYYVRARAAEALGYVALEQPEAVASPDVVADLRIGLTFDEPEVREKLAKALEYIALGDQDRLRHHVGDLATHLDDSEELVRYHLCTAIVAVGCAYPDALSEHVDALADRLSDDSPFVRGRAAEALGVLVRSEPDASIPNVSISSVSSVTGEDSEDFLVDRLHFVADVLDDDDVLDTNDVTDTDDVIADRQGGRNRCDVGTVRSIRAGTADVVTKIESVDDDSCPNCGVSIPGGGPPFCPQCGRPR
ncbi:sister chromatid cohesion protein PDS5 [Halostagnicola kamekurae]|uniref:HEAT repeat-containing protein n=1 Tax=Halostagnicola kamekurae TaxID=619731 RepID=A0A1I6TIS3_9EURY|nr:sister chromatid cohesion protein PDS5 [Halostagnicola kamekurae]SFS89162.1 hypothetical protein SAMN04488556_3152 [Halostagnicola kamekurae]